MSSDPFAIFVPLIDEETQALEALAMLGEDEHMLVKLLYDKIFREMVLELDREIIRDINSCMSVQL